MTIINKTRSWINEGRKRITENVYNFKTKEASAQYNCLLRNDFHSDIKISGLIVEEISNITKVPSIL